MVEKFQYNYKLMMGTSTVNVRISKKFGTSRYDWNVLRHCNAEYEFHVLLNGRAEIEVEEKRFELGAGQGIVIAPGQYHVPLSTSENMERFSISFSACAGELSALLDKAVNSYNLFSVSADMLRCCFEIFREYEMRGDYCNEKIGALLAMVMISLFRNFKVSGATLLSQSATETARADIIDYFFGNRLKERPGANQLAKMLHISERQLSRVIYQLYGMSFQEKMTMSRMETAAWLLRETDKKMSEIAEEIGYLSEAALYKAFLKYFKTTPHKYRTGKK